jgi:hypothetical protein
LLRFVLWLLLGKLSLRVIFYKFTEKVEEIAVNFIGNILALRSPPSRG